MTVMSIWSRLGLSWACGVQILCDGRFAARVLALRSRVGGEFDANSLPAPEPPTPPVAAPVVNRLPSQAQGALQLLALLQREGRFVDFVEQEVAAFSDADIGAAARVVHEGCRRALHAHARVVSVRSETEGATLTLERASADVKLVGNVAGSAPFRGVLRHRGWRVEELSLPTVVGEQDPKLVAAAELELP